tara:strand:+ start:2443 stop:2706 length:264 start_codon:yes stop_codon:yes gene_type:complete
MKSKSLNQETTRRNFLNKLAIGSPSGVVAGTVAISADDETAELSIILVDPNVRRGLNTCKGKGLGDQVFLLATKNQQLNGRKLLGLV